MSIYITESDFLYYKELRIVNFKRFAGVNVLPLHGDGNVTIIAAKNGVGKTTVLDAFNLALHGSKGIKQRYNKVGFKFDDWIKKTHNTTVQGEDCQVGVQLKLFDSVIGDVMISRDYWFEREGGPVDMELTVRINGKPLSLEAGESKHNIAQRWIEAFIPLAVSQRFLFDGEKLPDIDFSILNEELKSGLDDILGQHAIQQLNKHLNSIMKSTTKQMTPEDDQNNLDDWFEELENARDEKEIMEAELTQHVLLLEANESRSQSLENMLISKGTEEGENLGKIRSDQAVAAAKLAGRRDELIRAVSESIPFIIAGTPNELNDWEIESAKRKIDELESEKAAHKMIEEAVKKLKPSKKKRPYTTSLKKYRESILSQLKSELESTDNDISPLFQFLSKDDINSLEITHALIKEDITYKANSAVNDAIIALDNHEKLSSLMQAESERLGLENIAKEYKELSKLVANLRVDVVSRKSDLAKLSAFITEIEERIIDLQSLTEKDSKLNKRLESILQIRKIIIEYATQKRAALAKPLENGFSEGFKLLSRKASSVKSVTVSPTDYSPSIGMDGYEGNWLDRDLSATEKQHVGLSMLYAICKLSRISLPVVVDTPVSRMDKEHKGWSVTNFYPQLSHQVIVLTTSDDLSDGLFEELIEANCVGTQILLEETGPATAIAKTTNLNDFF
ncbi:MAG: hypothetical protein CMP75_03540 [Flavobacteriales bacterium]|nr:hypothetical protein [Flavobacteriales bacterium]